jgi:hypothetical protein
MFIFKYLFEYMLSVVDKEEKEDEMPATRVDVEMLWTG